MKRVVFWIFLAFCVLSSPAWGGTFDNRAALSGLQTAKVYFDVNLGDARKLLVRLDLLTQTVDQFVESGLTPEVVIGIRGGATKLFTRGTGHFKEEDVQYSEPIKKRVSELKAKGFVIEQCAIATQFLNVKAEDMLPEVTMVANGYVSMIGYQNKGYAVVPMD